MPPSRGRMPRLLPYRRLSSVWVGCVAGNGDKRGDYMLCLGPGMIVREQAEAVYAWDLDGMKHQVSVDFHDLVRAELSEWAGRAATAAYNADVRRKAAEENLAGSAGKRSGK